MRRLLASLVVVGVVVVLSGFVMVTPALACCEKCKLICVTYGVPPNTYLVCGQGCVPSGRQGCAYCFDDWPVWCENYGCGNCLVA